jgi:uncharacterized RDD family membrane protein YckC
MSLVLAARARRVAGTCSATRARLRIVLNQEALSTASAGRGRDCRQPRRVAAHCRRRSFSSCATVSARPTLARPTLLGRRFGLLVATAATASAACLFQSAFADRMQPNAAATPAVPSPSAAAAELVPLPRRQVPLADPAPLPRRWAAMAIDHVVFNVLFTGFSSVVGLSLGGLLHAAGHTVTLETLRASTYVLMAAFYCARIVFDCAIHAWGRQSIGKALCGIAIVDAATGSKHVHWSALVVRRLCDFPPLYPISVLLDRRSRCLHDLAAGTEVVVDVDA